MTQQIYATSSLGGYYSVPKLTSDIRTIAQPLMMFRRYARPISGAGTKVGDTIYFDKNMNPTSNGGTLSETSTIPRTSFSINQGTVSMTEYGNAIGYTGKLVSLGQLSIEESTREALKNSIIKVLDSTCGAQFQLADYKAVCASTATTTFSTNGVAGATATANMSDVNVRDIVDRLKKMNTPKHRADNMYHCIASTNALRGLYDVIEAKFAYTTVEQMQSGIVGEYYGTLFQEETNMLSNTIGLNSAYGEAVFFGDDAVIEALAIAEEIRMDQPKDFGRDLALAWYYLGGFKKVWDYSEDGIEHIIHVTSL
jgi:N4-gp56 family major capsid protein